MSRKTEKKGTRQNAELGGLNGDNLRISRAYLRISDHCKGYALGLGFGSGLGSGLELRLELGLGTKVRFRVANCCIQTAEEGDKMRINHVIKTDQWRCAPQIRPAPHFVVSRKKWLDNIRDDCCSGLIPRPIYLPDADRFTRDRRTVQHCTAGRCRLARE